MRRNKGAHRMRYLKSVDEIPRFKNEDEEAAYWSTHSLARIWDQLEPVEFTVSSKLRHIILKREPKKPVTLRLETRQIALAKKLAQAKSLSYQALMRSWINEGIAREMKKGA